MRLIDSTVLVVEDEPMLLEVTAGWFEREGGCVRTAEDGSRALEAMTSSRVDLIVTDIHMPELDGLSFLRKVKALGAYTPSIVFISSGSDVSARDGFDLGIEATFSKPVARLQLIAAAERILAGTGPLWGPAWHGETGPLLSATFGSLSSALRMGQIAFGKGGFCVESGNRSLEGPVQLAIDFAADARKLSGHGFVRWSSQQERRVGVEIVYLEETCRGWVIPQTALNATVSFIPRDALAAAREHAAGLSDGDSHELRNLLAVVVAYGDACQELLKPEDPLRNYVEQMRLCAQRAALLVHQKGVSEAIDASAIQGPRGGISDREVS